MIILALTIALMFSSGVEFMSLPDAERLYTAINTKPVERRTDDDKRLHAALTQALGIQRPQLTEHQACAVNHPDRHQPLCETMRGRRMPLQRSER